MTAISKLNNHCKTDTALYAYLILKPSSSYDACLPKENSILF